MKGKVERGVWVFSPDLIDWLYIGSAIEVGTLDNICRHLDSTYLSGRLTTGGSAFGCCS